MKEKKETPVKKIFETTTRKATDDLENAQFREFRNALRKDRNNNWKQSGNQLVQIEYESGYISTLERLLFDTLKELEGVTL